MFKGAYVYGLRRNETRMLGLTDFGRNSEGREFGEYGTLLVRYGKAKKGSPPKRRSVLTPQAPAPVVAKALGYHDKTATRLVTEGDGTWSRYAPGDH